MSGIVQWMKGVKSVFLESREAARFSAFISEDMKMYPCSFMVNTDMYANLREMSLKQYGRSQRRLGVLGIQYKHMLAKTVLFSISAMVGVVCSQK